MNYLFRIGMSKVVSKIVAKNSEIRIYVDNPGNQDYSPCGTDYNSLRLRLACSEIKVIMTEMKVARSIFTPEVNKGQFCRITYALKDWCDSTIKDHSLVGVSADYEYLEVSATIHFNF